MTYAPILLFVYNRPQHIMRAVASLKRNTLAAESRLIIYSDGPAGEGQQEAVGQVREYIRTITGFAGVTVVERDRNYGLASNIIEGVTAQLETYGRVIVLEDDLVMAPHFLQFMNDALEAYKDEPEVGHVHACDFTQDTGLPDTFLIRWTGSWGWGTWQRAWKHFNPDGKALLNELEERKLTRMFDFNGRYGYTRMLRRQTEGKNNSWAIRWNASLFLKGIFSLNTGRSLVQNTGFDGSGTNCGDDGLYASVLYQERVAVKKAEPIEENKQARTVFENYYARTNSFRAKAIRRIKKELKRIWKTN